MSEIDKIIESLEKVKQKMKILKEATDITAEFEKVLKEGINYVSRIDKSIRKIIDDTINYISKIEKRIKEAENKVKRIK